MKKLIITETTQNQRLDKYLRRYLPGAGTGFLYRMLREKKIKVNDKKADGSTLLKSGDVVTVYFSEETLAKFMQSDRAEPTLSLSEKAAADFQSRILYEDANVLILNKPAGMLSQKSRPEDVSACEMLVAYLFSSAQISEKDLKEYRPSAVNRLDRNTSGLLVCAKNLAAARELSERFRGRSIQKEYLALVHGRMQEERAETAWLAKEEKENRVRILNAAAENAVRIKTIYTPLAQLGNCTKMKVRLLTGKTHQIRAHLQALGFPIAGDPKYGDPEADRQLFGQKRLRQFLHAFQLTFPEMRAPLENLSGRVFRADLPPALIEMERVVRTSCQQRKQM